MIPKVVWPLSIVLVIGAGVALVRVLRPEESAGAAARAPALRGRYVLRRDDALAAAYAEAHEIVFGSLGIDTERVLPLEFEFGGDGAFRWNTPLAYDLRADRLAEVGPGVGLRTEGTGTSAPSGDTHVVLLFDATRREDAPGPSDPSHRRVVVSTTSAGFELIRETGQANVPIRHHYDLQR